MTLTEEDRKRIRAEIVAITYKEPVRWRSHIKYNGWNVWSYCYARTLEEAEEKFYQLRQQKDRTWVIPASIVPAGAYSPDEQEALDREQPDQSDKKERTLTPKEIQQWKENAQRAAEQLIADAKATPYVDLRPNPGKVEMRRLFGKRWQQMREAGRGSEAEEERAVEAFIETRRELDKEYNEAMEELQRLRRKELDELTDGHPERFFVRDQ